MSVTLCCHARDISFDVTADIGRTVAVVGPNGAGKSTALQLVAGLLAPSDGQVHVDGRLVAGPRTFLAPHQRDVGLLTQRALLFPHLDVLGNVAFGPRVRGVARPDAEARAMDELEAVGVAELARRRPRELSGGQAQRVALARALAVDPTVLLLDEPLAALDVEAAQGMRVLLSERLAGRTVMLVTHDPLDLWTLADDIVLVQDGRARRIGTVEHAAAAPPSNFLAGLLGLNRLVGVGVDAENIQLGREQVTGVPGAPEAMPGAPSLALFEPAAATLHPQGSDPESSARNRWTMVVSGVEPRGSLVRVRGRLADGQQLAADVTARSAGELGVQVGAELLVSVKAAQVSLVQDLREPAPH